MIAAIVVGYRDQTKRFIYGHAIRDIHFLGESLLITYLDGDSVSYPSDITDIVPAPGFRPPARNRGKRARKGRK